MVPKLFEPSLTPVHAYHHHPLPGTGPWLVGGMQTGVRGLRPQLGVGLGPGMESWAGLGPGPGAEVGHGRGLRLAVGLEQSWERSGGWVALPPRPHGGWPCCTPPPQTLVHVHLVGCTPQFGDLWSMGCSQVVAFGCLLFIICGVYLVI